VRPELTNVDHGSRTQVRSELMNDLEGHPGLTLCMSGKSRPRTANSGRCSQAAGHVALSAPKAFFLLSGSEVGLKT
jgi:hypothetical protein